MWGRLWRWPVSERLSKNDSGPVLFLFIASLNVLEKGFMLCLGDGICFGAILLRPFKYAI